MLKKGLGWFVLLFVTFGLISTIGTMLLSQAAIQQMEKPPEIKVINRSGKDLENIYLEGIGFSEQVGTIRAGESRWITVHPTGESGVYVSYFADGKTHKSDYESYFENSGGYRVIVTIDENLEVDTRYGSFLLP
jgi:hypothetical protein